MRSWGNARRHPRLPPGRARGHAVELRQRGGTGDDELSAPTRVYRCRFLPLGQVAFRHCTSVNIPEFQLFPGVRRYADRSAFMPRFVPGLDLEFALRCQTLLDSNPAVGLKLLLARRVEHALQEFMVFRYRQKYRQIFLSNTVAHSSSLTTARGGSAKRGLTHFLRGNVGVNLTHPSHLVCAARARRT